MRSGAPVFVVLILLISAAAGSCTNPTAPTNSSNANAPAANTSPGEGKSNPNQPSATVPGSSPTATIKEWRDAIRKKDADAFIKTYAQADGDFMREKAKADGQELNAWVKKGYLNNPNFANAFPPTLEVSDEQVTGDTAMLRMKNKKGRVKSAIIEYAGGGVYAQARLYFVKENGVWKLSPKNAPPFTHDELDKLDQELLDDMDP